AADFRLLSRRAVDALLELRETHRFLRGMVQWLGFPVAEVTFQPARRRAGSSKYDVRRMLRFAADGLLSFSRVPLRVSFFLGLLACAVALLGGGEAMIEWVWARRGIDSGLTLLASVYLLGGAILCALGIIGEYVGRIYEQVKARPLYLLKETS